MKRFGVMPIEKVLLDKIKYQVESDGVYLWCGSYEFSNDGKKCVFHDALVCSSNKDTDDIQWAFYDNYEIYNLQQQFYVLSPAVSLMRLVEKSGSKIEKAK